MQDSAHFLQGIEEQGKVQEQRKELSQGDLLLEDQIQHEEEEADP